MQIKSLKYPNEIHNRHENLSSNTKTRPFYHSDFKSSLESIVFKKTSEKENTLERFFFDKSKTSKATVKALLSEIELREMLNLHLLNKANEDISRQNNNLFSLKRIKYPLTFELSKEINKRIDHLQDNVLELEKEKRKEYLECWRDLLFLKKYLHTALKDYWDLVKKREILKGNFLEMDEDEI